MPSNFFSAEGENGKEFLPRQHTRVYRAILKLLTLGRVDLARDFTRNEPFEMRLADDDASFFSRDGRQGGKDFA